ncbi:hypothetical protein L0F63_003034 [Massospora cicadina]|nr:hypothetical protein L0F63_003034 [Massospora cicadina]
MSTQGTEHWQDLAAGVGPLFPLPFLPTPYTIDPCYTQIGLNHDLNQLLYPEWVPVTYDPVTPSNQPVYQPEVQLPISQPSSSPSSKGDGKRLGYPETTTLQPGVHVPRTKPTLLTKDPSKSKRCSICHQPFERDNSLRRHEMLHSGVKPFKCKPCNKEFTRQDIYRRHQQSTRCRKATERCHRFIFAYK